MFLGSPQRAPLGIIPVKVGKRVVNVQFTSDFSVQDVLRVLGISITIGGRDAGNGASDLEPIGVERFRLITSGKFAGRPLEKIVPLFYLSAGMSPGEPLLELVAENPRFDFEKVI